MQGTATGAMVDGGDTVATDRPIDDRAQDAFGRAPFAEAVARLVLDRSDPGSLVIGVYGSRGDGKSSVLKLVEQALRDSPIRPGRSRPVCIWFNPWVVGKDEELVATFFGTLAAGLRLSLGNAARALGQKLARYGDVFPALTFSVLPGIGTVGIQAGKPLKTLGEQLAEESLESRKQKVGEELGKLGRRVVVLMDDIDRLDDQEIQAVFRLVKLTADFDWITYVLAFDDRAVAAALDKRYSGGRVESGRGFLEKIVQLPLHLPAIGRDVLRSYCLTGLDRVTAEAGVRLGEEQRRRFHDLYVAALEPRPRTPRMCKRYLNAAAFALRLLRDETEPVDVLAVEGLRTLYPDVHERVRAERDILLGTRRHEPWARFERGDEEPGIESAFVGAPARERSGIAYLLADLFPARGGMETLPAPEDGWARSRRVCSERYFDRYFSYAVPPNELPDRLIDVLLGAAADGNFDVTADRVRQLATTYGPDPLLEALRRRWPDVSSRACGIHARALADHGELFPPTWWDRSAAFVIRRLVGSIASADERARTAGAIVHEGRPVPFVARCLLELTGGDGSAPWASADSWQDRQRASLDAGLADELGQALCRRVEEYILGMELYVLDEHDFRALCAVLEHWGSLDGLRRRFSQALTFGRIPLDSLLRWRMPAGLAAGQDDYIAVMRVATADDVLAAIVREYGQRLVDEAPGQRLVDIPGEMPEEESRARNFVRLHAQRT